MMRLNNYIFLIVFTLAMTVEGDLYAQGEPRKIKAAELVKMAAESTTPVVINFWATFCKPCLEEIPYFQELASTHQADSVRLLLVSLDLEEDFPATLFNFLKKRRITAPVAWLDEYNADYFCPLIDTQWSGALPATLFINNKSGYRHFAERPYNKAQLTEEFRRLTAR